MTSPLLEQRFRRSTATRFIVALAATLAAGTAYAGDEQKPLDPECAEEVVTKAAAETDLERTNPEASPRTGSLPADETGANPECGEQTGPQHDAKRGEHGVVQNEKDTVSDEKVQQVKDEAAAEPDEGRTDPRENWMTESPPENSEERPKDES